MIKDLNQLFEEVTQLLTKDRQSSYGDPDRMWERNAVLMGLVAQKSITPEQALLNIVAVKFARLCHDPAHQDSIKDAIAYLAILYARTKESSCSPEYP